MPSDYSIVLSYRAQNDLKSIAAFYKMQVGPIGAKRITDKLLDKIDLLGRFPSMGIEVPSRRIAIAGVRMLIVDEYLCFYSEHQQSIVVHHIVHGSVDYMKSLFGTGNGSTHNKQ